MARTGYLSLLKDKNYLLLWLGQNISNIGDMSYNVAFFWLVYQMSDSSLEAGITITAATIPYLFFGLIGGAYADKLNRKRLMIVSDIIRALAVIIIPIIDFFFLLTLWHLGFSAFILSAVRCFFYPSLRAAIPQLLSKENWAIGNSFLQASFQLTRIIGPVIGGFLIATYSAITIYIINFATFVISLLCLLPISLPAIIKQKKEENIFISIYETFKFIKTVKPLFIAIMFFGMILLCYVGLERIGVPILVDGFWSAGSKGFGIIIAMIGGGHIAGSLVLGKLKIHSFSSIIFAGWILWGSSLLLLGSSSNYEIALLFAFMIGVAEAMNDIPMVLLIQDHSPQEIMGKVFSFWSTIAFIGESASSLVTGSLLHLINIKISFIIGGLLIILSGTIAFIMGNPVRTKEY